MQYSQVLIRKQPPRTLPSYRKGQCRVISMDKLFSVHSPEFSLVAQLNIEHVDEQAVITPWIEALRERTMAELPVRKKLSKLVRSMQ